MYNIKNYTEPGGDVTHIGGKLIIEEGGEVEGLVSKAKNQAPSTATQVSGLKSDFNALLVKLKEAGIMEPEHWNLSVRLAPALSDKTAADNNARASVALDGNTIVIAADLGELEESEVSGAGEGAHKWIGIGIGTGLSSVSMVKCDGTVLTSEDKSVASVAGLNQEGEFLLYIPADEAAKKPKAITLKAESYPEITLSMVIAGH